MSTETIMSNDVITKENIEENVDKFSRTFIESLDPKVKKVDSDGEIDLFCYTTCDESDPDYVKACRGLVFHGDKLVLKAFSYNPDYTANDYEYLDKTYPDTSKLSFFDAHEGALIRVFYAGGDEEKKWFVSTHRRLNAFRSKWSSRTSFGECFSQALEYEFSTQEKFKNRILSSPLETQNEQASVLEKFISTLDTSMQYMFLIQNNKENRIVCDAPEYPRVFHVGTFSEQSNALNITEFVDLEYPIKHSFNTMDDVMEYVENSVDCKQLQGVIMFTDTEQIKILNREYKYLFDLRGNESSIKYRYLQMRMNPEKLADFQKLYSAYSDQFDMYEDTIYEIAVQIFNAYLNRFIHKKHVTMPPEEYSIMKECHSWHISNRADNHISFDKVMRVLNAQDSSKTNKMIRRYLNNQRLKSIRTDQELEDEDAQTEELPISRILQRQH